MSFTTTYICTWRTPIIAGLIQFATTTPHWGDWLAVMIRNQSWFATFENEILPHSNPKTFIWHTPRSTEQATRITEWLLSAAPLSVSDKLFLNTFAVSREVPRDIIFFGVGMGMIPGLTIGDPTLKKKKCAQLAVIIDESTYVTLTKPALVQLALKTAVDTVARELRRVGGDTKRLHPDTADWLMSEPATALYTTDQTSLTAIATTAHTELILTSRASPENPALGISPAVAESFLELFPLTRVEA